jgi:4-amino-4-deoxy-L-arabinose transferase-like glycosyltransferase
VLGLGLVVLLGFVLRLAGIHDPILDHPGWRQGDTAAIARNFATLDFNPLHPQTDYDGPPPNYVELELQIVPWLAAALYRIFGIHEVFGRLISIAFSLGTIVVAGNFARWMFGGRTAGFTAALAFALYPGSVYYGRTFTPDTTMTFFLTAAVFASARWIVDDEARFGRRFWFAAALTALALLAKPVAIVGLVPIAAALIAARGLGPVLRSPLTYAFFALALAPYVAYDLYVRSIAEWHWASGITRLHVLPALAASFESFGALRHKLGLFRGTLRQLGGTMLGPVGLSGLLAGCLSTIVWRVPAQSRALLWGWLAAALAYAYVVVTVERVDYYLYPFLPLAAVWTGGFAESLRRALPPGARRPAAFAGLAVAAGALYFGHQAVKPYYAYGKVVYRQAKALDATLAPGALIVMGHYDPSVLYYINRKGWEEDPYLWTPFDEESAIAKGARYFIAIEPKRLRRNVELHAWLERFPVANAQARWPVYETDPAKILPGAEARWKAFRRAEKAGQAASFGG